MTLVATETPSFALNNPGAPNALYISDSTADNRVTLTIAFTGSATLSPATLVPYAKAGAGQGSLLYLDLRALQLGPSVVGRLALVASGWSSAPYSQDNMIAITPTKALKVSAGEAISFELTGFVLPDGPGTQTVPIQLDMFHVPGIATGMYPAIYTTTVALVYPSDAKLDLHDALEFRISPGTVNLSDVMYAPIENSLQLILSLKDGQASVKAGPDTVFTLSVVYASDADGYGALMTQSEGTVISIPQPPRTGWTPENVAGTSGRSWTLKPEPNQELPTPGGGPVAFDFSPVVSYLRPSPTKVLLAYSDVPGYKDGAFAFTLIKQPHVRIQPFDVQPALSELKDGSASVELTWVTVNASSLELNPGNHNVTGKNNFTATIDGTTTFSLTAYGAGGNGVNNVAFRTATAKVVAVLDRLAATPPAIAADELVAGGTALNLTWAINAGATSELQLDSSEGGVLGQKLGLLASTNISVSEPQMYTLSVQGQEDPRQQWKAYVPAFHLQQQPLQQQPSGGPFSGTAAAPRASYVVTCLPESGAISVLSTATYQQIATVAVGGTPTSIAFAPDGHAFFVLDKAGAMVTTVEVEASEGSPPWSFTIGTKYPLGGAPQRVVYASGGVLYATVNNGSPRGSLAAIDLAKGTVTKTPAGVGASGLAVLPSGAQIFVSNTVDGTVSQIGRALDGSYQLIETIRGLPGAAGIAVTPDAEKVVVGCSDGTVRIVDTRARGVTPSTTVAVGGTPTAIVLDPSGTYAFALDTQNDRVVLISLARSAVIGAPMTVASGSTGIAISPDGMITLVDGEALTVIALQTYLGQAAGTSCNGLVSDAVVTSDGGRVFAWADASVEYSHVAPAAGMQVYDSESQTVTPYFTDRKIIGVTVPRSAGFDTGFVSILGESAFYPLDCGALQLANPIALPPKSGVSMRQPQSMASSADGQTAFTVSQDADNAFSLVVLEAQSAGSWRVTADVPLFTAKYQALSVPLVAAPDGSSVYVYDSTNGQVWIAVRDGAGGYSLDQAPLPAPGDLAAGFVISDDGTNAYLAVQKGAGTIIYAIDTTSRAIEAIPLTEPISAISIRSMAISPDGTRVFATDQTSGSVRVIDTASLRFLQTVTWPTSLAGPAGIAVAPDQSCLFVATHAGQLAVAGQLRPSPRRARAALMANALAGGQLEQGVFIRHQLGNTPGNNGGSFSSCPDIVLSVDANNAPAPLDPATLINDAGYAKDYGNSVSQGQINYVYLRGLNDAALCNPVPAMAPRFWLLYCASNLALWPQSWRHDNIQVGAVGQNYQDATDIVYNQASAGQLMATSQPFLWSPPVLTDGNHYCLVSMAENPLQTPPWVPDIGAFNSWDDLVTFVLANDWFGWRNTVAVDSRQPTWQQVFPIAGPPRTQGQVQVGVQCTTMPKGSQFRFVVLGPSGSTDGVDSGLITITDPNETYTLPMLFPAGFNTSMELSYYQNNAPAPQTGSKLSAYLGQTQDQVLSLMLRSQIKRQPIQAIDLAQGHWHTVYPFGSISAVFT